MPTSPQTSILAAVTQALPGPTIRSTGAMPASGRPYASAPIAWAPPATTKASTSSRPAAPSRTGWTAPSRSAGEATTIRSHAGDLRRHDGHHQRRRVRRRAARDVGADRGERRPAALDLDAGDDRRAGRGRPLGLGEAADVVDRLVEGAADVGVEARRGGAEVVGVEDEPAVRAAAADALRWPRGRPRRRGRGRRRGSRGRRRGSAGPARRRVGRARRGRRRAAGRRPPRRSSRRRSEARRSRGVERGRVTGRSSRSAGRGCRTRPAALRRGSRPQTSSAPTTEWIAIMPVVRERDDRRRFERRAAGASSSASFVGRGVHHQVLAAAGGDDRAEHRVDRGELGGALAIGGRVGDEHRLRREDVADLAQAVHDERRAGRDEVDDGLGEPEPRRDLDRARDRDDLDRDAALRRRTAGPCSGAPSRRAGRRGPRRSGSGASFGTAAARRHRP